MRSSIYIVNMVIRIRTS